MCEYLIRTGYFTPILLVSYEEIYSEKQLKNIKTILTI